MVHALITVLLLCSDWPFGSRWHQGARADIRHFRKVSNVHECMRLKCANKKLLFRRYVKAVASTIGAEHTQWEELREQLQLASGAPRVCVVVTVIRSFHRKLRYVSDTRLI